MDPPKCRKKREASLKKKEKGHAYNARHVRMSLSRQEVPQGPILANGAST
jgi:hypothetical protein